MNLFEMFRVCTQKHTEFNYVSKNNVGFFSTLVIKFCVVSFKAVFQTHAHIVLHAAVHSLLLLPFLYTSFLLSCFLPALLARFSENDVLCVWLSCCLIASLPG
jgi:hypothetical protein